jgi:uncharacterized protein (TIGR02757 family)
LWTAILSWGQRKTIINKCKELFSLMDDAPYEFIINHSQSDLKRFRNFKHRTFNYTDTLYFISFFKWYYSQNKSLENLFVVKESDETIQNGLANFHNTFCSLPNFPSRTRKHISTPVRNSACKRLNMFLRWMVRKDSNEVDFGIWRKISPSKLICPCDIHVENVAKKLGLVSGKKADLKMALELTRQLRQFDCNDPVKYDFALFGLGVEEKFWH